MMTKDITRTVNLVCPTCASDQFSTTGSLENDYVEVTCGNCGRKMSKEDLIRENEENLESHAYEIGEEMMKQMIKKLNRR